MWLLVELLPNQNGWKGSISFCCCVSIKKTVKSKKKIKKLQYNTVETIFTDVLYSNKRARIIVRGQTRSLK